MTYAEGQLDDYLMSFFPEGYKGTFIDVGACHPELNNNSLLFEKAGWQVICIEPNPRLAELLRAYPRSNVQQIAIGKADSDCQDFTIFTHPTLGQGSCSALGDGVTDSAMFKIYAPQTTSREKIKVNVRTLDTLLGAMPVDILSVDTEGTELDVIAGFASKARYVVLEDFEENNIKAEYMKARGYSFLRRINYNFVFGLINSLSVHSESIA